MLHLYFLFCYVLAATEDQQDLKLEVGEIGEDQEHNYAGIFRSFYLY
jgi:hypothetical protein